LKLIGLGRSLKRKKTAKSLQKTSKFKRRLVNRLSLRRVILSAVSLTS